LDSKVSIGEEDGVVKRIGNVKELGYDMISNVREDGNYLRG
jgi:hypothetical protein